jgi:glycosyltransferase involved in cell wall biosynthesis
MTVSVHQFLAGAAPGDAITRYAFYLDRLMRRVGAGGALFAPGGAAWKELENRVLPLKEYARVAAPEDSVIYHYSTSSVATEIFKRASGRRILCYHNITPARFFLPFSDGYAGLLREGREELASLASSADLSLADSDFNRRELEALGFERTRTLPLPLDGAYLETSPAKSMLRRLRDGAKNWLFVGRLVPNKRFEDLIRVFALYRKEFEPRSRLVLAGDDACVPAYTRFLRARVAEWDLRAAVLFTGRVSLGELIACYRAADAFVCLSRHEGFCLPVLESMALGVPVFALDRAAVSETLGGAGVLLREAPPLETAALVHAVLSRPGRIESLRRRQRERASFFSEERFRERFFRALSPLVPEPAPIDSRSNLSTPKEA